MSKMRALLLGATAAGALAAASIVPAHADHVTVPGVGNIHVQGTGPDDGSISADGEATNPDPLDGYIVVSSDGICASDEGAPGDPGNCNEAIITSQLP